MPEGLLCAELVREFLEFYRMTYTLEIFLPECNLPPEDKLRDKLETKLGLKGKAENPTIPILMQLVQIIQQQNIPNAQSDVPAASSSGPSEDQLATKSQPGKLPGAPKFAPENLFVKKSPEHKEDIPGNAPLPKVEERKIEAKKPEEKKMPPQLQDDKKSPVQEEKKFLDLGRNIPEEKKPEIKKQEEKKVQKEEAKKDTSNLLAPLPPLSK